MTSTLQKLQAIANNNPAEAAANAAAPVQAVTNGAAAPAGAAEEVDGLVASLEEQLSGFYGDLDYLNKHFPNHSIRTLVDYAISLKEQSNNGTSGKSLGFLSAELLGQMASLTQEQADACDFGIVEVDDRGAIKIYNQYEADLAGLQKDSVFGKNFFLEVAPCTNNQLFLGRFKQGVSSQHLEVFFNYTFTYKMRPTNVSIVMYREPQSQRNFVFVKKR